MLFVLFFDTFYDEFSSSIRNIELHDTTKILCLIHQVYGIAYLLNHFLIATKEEVRECVTQVVLVWIWFRHIQYTRHNVGISEAAVLLSGFQQQGKLCQLLGTSVNINTCEVVTEDVLDGLTTAITFKYIEVIEHIKAFIENVT